MKRIPSLWVIARTVVLAYLFPAVQPAASAMEWPGHQVAQESQTTTWTGTLDARGTPLRLEIDITENAGDLSGELRSLDQNNATLALDEIRIAGDSLQFAVPMIGARFGGAYATDRTEVEGTFSQSGVQLPLVLVRSGATAAPADPIGESQLVEAWVGELEMGGVMRPVMQFRWVVQPTGDTLAYFDSVTEGRTGFPATRSINGDTLAFDVGEINLTYRGRLNDARDAADGTWSQGGRSLKLTLRKQDHAYETPNVWENRPQRPVGPFPYDAEEVAFENAIDGIVLAGTLTLPRRPGPHPVVVLISGSGPQDRDQTLMEHKPFLVLADYMTRRGIAVLRYDDRGTAESTGDFAAATTEDLARDASAAVEFLTRHDRVNPDEIGLVGHSEGGLIAPMVVGLRDDVAFVVLLAAPGVGGAKIIETQTEAMLRAAGTDEAVIAAALAINRAVLNHVRHGDPESDSSEELESAIERAIEAVPESDRAEVAATARLGVRNALARSRRAWVRFFLDYDPRPALRNIRCPVLAVTGSKDLQVLPDLNLPEIEKALIEGGNDDFEVIELDGLNHLFQQSDTGSISEYATIQETFNPVALATIGNWIIDHTTPNN